MDVCEAGSMNVLINWVRFSSRIQREDEEGMEKSWKRAFGSWVFFSCTGSAIFTGQKI